MRELKLSELEDYEPAAIYKEKTSESGFIVRLFLACENEHIGFNLAEEDGFFIQVLDTCIKIGDAYLEWVEPCNTINLIEACKAFNEVCQALL